MGQCQDMKTIILKNKDGETIEVQSGADGQIRIRHSAIDRKAFGEFHEWSKRLKQPKAISALKQRGIDLESEEGKQAVSFLAKVGGYVVIRGELQAREITAEETALIYDAIKSSGGIVPNWSNR
jgi:hypothetical protein